ncbi:11787_t:CDS:2, partial [Ambispora leptoticha]
MNSTKQNNTPKVKHTLAADTCTQPLPITLSNSQPPSLLSTIFGYFHIFKTATNEKSSTATIGIFDKFSRNIIVENKEHIDLLWKSGFFGKGTLSRGEPTWFSRNRGKNPYPRNGLSLEEITKKRREERKTRRKKKQNEEPIQESDKELNNDNNEIDNDETTLIDDNELNLHRKNNTNDPKEKEFQLTLEEAFFLCFGIGSLLIYDTNQKLLSIKDCWDAFRSVAATSMISFSSLLVQMNIDRWDNSFVIRYVAFHYFRSMGWV